MHGMAFVEEEVMKRIIKGFQVIYHSRSDDALGKFYEEPRKRSWDDDPDRAQRWAMQDAEHYADQHALEYGYGSASVFHATIKLEGPALRRIPKPPNQIKSCIHCWWEMECKKRGTVCKTERMEHWRNENDPPSIKQEKKRGS